MKPASFTGHALKQLSRRFLIRPAVVAKLLDSDQAVPVGTERCHIHRLFYSIPDNRCAVAVQDEETGEIITVLPLSLRDRKENYHHRWRIDAHAETMAKALQGILPPKIEPAPFLFIKPPPKLPLIKPPPPKRRPPKKRTFKKFFFRATFRSNYRSITRCIVLSAVMLDSELWESRLMRWIKIPRIKQRLKYKIWQEISANERLIRACFWNEETNDVRMMKIKFFRNESEDPSQ